MNKSLNFLKKCRLEIFLIIIISFGISMFLFGENLSSKWWVIDDHEIMMFLGEDGKLTLWEIPEILIEKTEVGDYGHYERYRPSYYFIRLIETSVWGDNPGLWYFTRILILSFFLSTVWYLVYKYTDFIKGFLIIVIVLSAHYWMDIFSRLGPAEAYAVLGFSMYLLGLSTQLDYLFLGKNVGNRTSILSLFLIVIGGIIAIGSKENFIILIVPVVIFFVYGLIKKKLSRGFLMSSTVVILYAGFVMSSILIAISGSGSDIYNSDINLKDLILMTCRHIPELLEILWIKYISIVLILSSFVVYRFKKIFLFKKYLKRIGAFYLSVICIMGLYLSQFLFYKGSWPTDIRYDFPGLLYFPLYILIIFFITKYTFKVLNLNNILKEILLNFIFLCAILISPPFLFIKDFQYYSAINVIKTNQYMETIESVVKLSKQDPSKPIFLETYVVDDHELIVSVNRLLRAKGVKNPIYININNYSAESFKDPLQRKLAEEIALVSDYGGELAGEIFIERTEEIFKEPGCITLNFSGVKEDICNSFIIR